MRQPVLPSAAKVPKKAVDKGNAKTTAKGSR